MYCTYSTSMGGGVGRYLSKVHSSCPDGAYTDAYIIVRKLPSQAGG